jgi:hypothetical protein
MYKLYCGVLFVIIATLGIAASVPDGLAQVNESQKLPPEILALVPQGAQLIGQDFAITEFWAKVTFVAEKKSGLRSQDMTRYHLVFDSFDNNDYWKTMIAPGSREEIEANSKNSVKGWDQNSSPMVSPPFP